MRFQNSVDRYGLMTDVEERAKVNENKVLQFHTADLPSSKQGAVKVDDCQSLEVKLGTGMPWWQ